MDNNRFLSLANKAADLVILSVLWAVCALPVVTVGASTAALFHAVTEAVKEEREYAAAAFFSSFRQHLKACCLFHTAALISLLSFCAAAYRLYHYRSHFLVGALLVFFLLCICINLIVQLHAYYLIGCLDVTGKQFRFALLRLSAGGVVKNSLILFELIFAVELILRYPPLLLIVPGVLLYTIAAIEDSRIKTPAS